MLNLWRITLKKSMSQNNWHKYSQCLQPHLYEEVVLGHHGINKNGISKMLTFFLCPPTHFPSLWVYIRSVQVKLGGKTRKQHFTTVKHNGNVWGADYSVAWLWTLSPGWVNWGWASSFGVWICWARLGFAKLCCRYDHTWTEQNKQQARMGLQNKAHKRRKLPVLCVFFYCVIGVGSGLREQDTIPRLGKKMPDT